MSDLKPCPHCGELPDVVETNSGFQVLCSGCDMATYSDDWTEEKAIEIWNARHNGWISVDERLPEQDFCYCLTYRHYHSSPERGSVQYSFFTKDRAMAREKNKYYSRKYQGKLSVHFDSAESGFVVTHWMPLPEPPTK